MKLTVQLSVIATLVTTLTLAGCGSKDKTSQGDAGQTIQVEGSDTMVNLAQAWSEKYQQDNADVTIEVSGGGSGVGISSLIQGLADMANASRKMKAKETARAKSELGVTPVEYIVGQDALAVYVHKDNPLNEITVAQLEAIYADGGTISKWSELGIEIPGGSDEIVRISRQNNSGTYAYFREAVLQDNDFKLGSIDLSGSSDVVSMVEKTASAIGYSGMGYATDDVKMLNIKTTDDGEAVAPTADNVINGTYPIARPLLIYTAGEPNETLKNYLAWILGENGQAIVSEMGYVPVQ
ncbi:MAG: phosphate-binding protein [Planctomycetaceae bacterium]|nr:phosphate-binding protein [Planctomycetaceae bacterium]|tara:strand:- start:20873 stop:21757 length:885 start_codon:yes stop_codon:yes gene_type:complete